MINMINDFFKRYTVHFGICALFCISNGFAQEVPQNFSLYTDKKAKKMEDIVTVLIVEEAQAKNDTRTETDVESNVNFNLAPGQGVLQNVVPGIGFGVGNEADYDGRGKTSRLGQVKAKVSARIVAVYDNGNLLIEGNKEVEINNETEMIRVSGIIRPEDVDFDNTIYSFKIADARIQYTGKGDSQNAHRPGFLTRFFNWLF